MMKTFTGLAVAATVAAAAVVAAPQQAEARCVGCYVGAGIVGGAILGAAIASSPRDYGPGPYYGYYPAYYGPRYYRGPGCFWRTSRVWTNHGWRVRRVQVCR
jgi:hypothetical protein